jgi:V/A-type H+-transporting ATPase subunit C
VTHLGYGANRAKIKAMTGKLISPDGFFELANSASIAEVAGKLSSYPAYAESLANIEAENLRRAYIEDRINQSFFSEYKRIYSFLREPDIKKYLELFKLKAQISKIRKRLILESSNISDFLNTLEPKSLKKYLTFGTADDEFSLFKLQIKLDIYYYAQAKKAEDFLSGADIKIARAINGTEIDLQNIMWLIRLKTFYHANVSEIYAYLAPFQYNLTRAQIIKMAETNDAESLFGEIKKTRYAPYFTKSDDEFKNIARGFYKAMFDAYKSIKTNRTLPLVLFYLFRKSVETRNIYSVIEGVRYSLSPEALRPYLIFEN